MPDARHWFDGLAVWVLRTAGDVFFFGGGELALLNIFKKYLKYIALPENEYVLLFSRLVSAQILAS